MVAECKETQSRAMSQLTIDQLALHLRYALQRMKTSGVSRISAGINNQTSLSIIFLEKDFLCFASNVEMSGTKQV